MKSFKKFLEEGRCWPGHKPVPGKKPYSPGSCIKEGQVEQLESGLKKLDNHRYSTIDKLMQSISKEHGVTGKELHDSFVKKHDKTPDEWIKTFINEDWQKVNKADRTDGLSQKAVDAYRRENPGSKLQTAVTEKDPSGKRASRRKSFCSRMSGMKKRLTNPENARDPDSPINKALRRWRC
jgi:hypothetical protein